MQQVITNAGDAGKKLVAQAAANSNAKIEDVVQAANDGIDHAVVQGKEVVASANAERIKAKQDTAAAQDRLHAFMAKNGVHILYAVLGTGAAGALIAWAVR